jgi:catechol 2,3-dioxygenase-like lactoylglutathione lyase family enzyme
VVVFVDHVADALAFYVGKLGLERRGDGEALPGLQSAEVGVPGARTSIVLVQPSLEAMGAFEASRAHERVGEPAGVVFEVESLQAAREELERHGVEFVHGPSWQSLGRLALRIGDPSGNEPVLVEVPARS